MNKRLILAEKPSVARDIARVLNCNKKGNGYFESQKDIVTWALGHLVTLADPEVYNKQYASWRLEDLPILPDSLKLIVIKKTSKQFNTIKELLGQKDVKEIVIATDAGREGELVARWIIEKSKINKPIKRLWISSVTDKAIKEGFSKLKDGKAYEKLYDSAVARSEADWLVGINATRALTTKYNAQLSCGRVQTPTLEMVAQREEEIRNFTPKKYYGLYVIGDGLKFVWQDKTSREVKTFNREKVEKVSENIRNKKIEIKDVKKTQKKSYAPQLYNLTELQRDANKIFGYSAKETLNIMQRLYENYKLLTYPRTDSRFISTDIIDTLKDRIKACGVGPYSNIAHKLLAKPLKISKLLVDNSKVSDHHAIIPTEQRVLLGALSDSERKIYDLVVKRFISALYEPFEYEQTNVIGRIGEEEFLLQGINVIRLGWKEVYKNNIEYDMEEVLEKQLPIISIGEHLNINSIERTEGETKPPSRFTEGSLLSAMENPSKYVNSNNKELIKTLAETGGIGTVATRADIIEKLFNSFLIELKGKEIFITAKGKQLLDLVPEDLKSPELTATWEHKLNAISNGSLQKDSFIKDMKDYARRLIDEIKNSESKFKHTNVTGNKCPECGKNLLEVKNKKGKLLVCQDRDCGYKKGVSRVTNARCTNCKKKLELRGEGEGQIFVCSCGFREKLSSFNERKKEKGDIASKKDISKFLKDQKKSSQEPINTALSDALSKLKFD
ncbi:DNA topoisomerase III [Serpentinicella alkaliphila]|uniref:DNA topoisomerase 3 n=1 Tax=Serpentinicella alkaliphila TaxID=1734049 RepID=A0A4R2TVK9_9FIRM|nr:DNA topoisomerase III [Serpentinicella alkaliphila]QUH26715.1 DNA topoisomerase III [Serpentinicella alkaliphila]TCQ07931.1 DNA topoisomerase-3 [Serpentinicella alkaliphila]